MNRLGPKSEMPPAPSAQIPIDANLAQQAVPTNFSQQAASPYLAAQPAPATGAQPATTAQPANNMASQQIPAYMMQELLMGARYGNPYMSGVSGPYQMPQYAGLQNIAPWAMPQNMSTYGGGFMPSQFNLQPQYNQMPNMNNIYGSLAGLGVWR
jgi:hypothetical protein